MNECERKPDEEAVAVEYVGLQWQFRCIQVHGDGDPFMADAYIKDGTVVCRKCGTTEHIKDMDLRYEISEGGKIKTWVTPEKFKHFSSGR